MPVTIHDNGTAVEKPSEAIVKAANQVFRITDTRGRCIAFKKLSMLDKMRLYEIVGAQNVHNEMYFGHAMLAAHAIEIDGEGLAPMATKRELEARVVQLDEEGINALALGVSEHLAPNVPQDVRDEIKNALSTPN